jgi:hypothetical protein
VKWDVFFAVLVCAGLLALIVLCGGSCGEQGTANDATQTCLHRGGVRSVDSAGGVVTCMNGRVYSL